MNGCPSHVLRVFISTLSDSRFRAHNNSSTYRKLVATGFYWLPQVSTGYQRRKTGYIRIVVVLFLFFVKPVMIMEGISSH